MGADVYIFKESIFNLLPLRFISKEVLQSYPELTKCFPAAVAMDVENPERLDASSQQAEIGCGVKAKSQSTNMMKTKRSQRLDDAVGEVPATESQDPFMTATPVIVTGSDDDDDDDDDDMGNNNNGDDDVGEGPEEMVDYNNNIISVRSIDCNSRACWAGSSSSVSSN